MAKAEGLPPTASVASVGPGINYIANWAYAYSGSVTTGGAASADTTYLNFTTGSGFIIAQFQFIETYSASADRYIDLTFNDLEASAPG